MDPPSKEKQFEKQLEKRLINATIRGDDIDILRENNPEVFSVLPDPGHHHFGSPSTSAGVSSGNKQDQTNFHGPGTSWGRIQTAMQEVWRQKELQMSEEDGLNFDNMLPVAMSTVIMLATTPDVVPMEYYMWTEKYLSCIKDESGHMPHNIGNMVRMIHHRCKDLGYKWDPAWGLMPPEPDDDRVERKRLQKERRELKKAEKEIKHKEKEYEKREENREKLAEEREKARKKDADKMDNQDTGSKDSKGNGSKGSKRASSASITRQEKELTTPNTVTGSPKSSSPKAGSPKAGSPKAVSPKTSSPKGSKTGSQQGSRRASSTDKSGGSQTRQAGGGRPISDSAFNKDSDESDSDLESLDVSATIMQ